MQKIFVFILGFVTGVVLTIIFAGAMSNSSNSGNVPGLNMFDEPGDCLVNKSSLEIFSVVYTDAALARIKGRSYDSLVYLLVNDEGKAYYDDMVVKLPSGKCFKQIGTYQYTTKAGFLKTVPVVQIM